MAWFLSRIIYFATFYSAIEWALLGQSEFLSSSWTNWSQCLGRCGANIQLRECLGYCGDIKLEIRQCSKSQNCRAYKMRILKITDFWTKVKLETNASRTWKSFCHAAWDINMAHAVCRIRGFPSAEAALQGDKHIENDSCVLSQENNETCDFFEREISRSCNLTNEAVAVCKVPVSIDGSYSGVIQLPLNGTLQTMSVQGWNMKGADVVCRELGFKRAIAPFSTNDSQPSVTSMCIMWINCYGNETSLSFCSMSYTAKCKGNATAIASVTCDPSIGLIYLFRKVILTRLGESVNHTCDLATEKSYWYDVNGQRISESQKSLYQVSLSAFKTRLILLNLTLESGGVYFCNGANQYGSLIIYVQGEAPTGTTRRISLKKGQTETIDCNIFGVPKPMVTTWWKDDKLLYDCSFLESEKDNLIIQNATFEDAGSYVCKTVQVYEFAKRVQKTTFYVDINAGFGAGSVDNEFDTPDVYIDTENMTFTVGQKVNLLCKIKSSRLFASAKWIREKTKQILKTHNFSFVENSTSYDYHDFSHTIDHVSSDDAGYYTCVVTFDGYESQRVSYKLQATDPGKERPEVYIATENVAFGVDERVYLVCKIEKKEVFIAAKWIREETKQTLETATFSSDANTQFYHQFYYEIEKVSVKDEGVYKCVANFSGYGQVEAWYNLQVEEHESEGTNSAAVITLSLLSAFLCLGIIGYFVYHRRRVSVQIDDVPSVSAENWALEGTLSRWEIPSQHINLRSVLGSGTFGEVWKAVVWGLNGYPGDAIVAVKKLKHNSSDSEKESLTQELELGRSLQGDRHPNIVNFLGCVSVSDASLMLLLEYAPYGDLLGYLRKSRGLEDKYYTSHECCRQEVTSYDLVSFSQQIASGMSFLASKKILHRDLAARNILVGEGRTLKITDFGLALLRDNQHIYCTTIRKGRLPIKWTAPEHLFNDSEDNDIRVSEKSDVWSFGIVLFEVFTLGGLPYPGWGEWKVVYELKVNKYRMDQPDHVSDEIYQIMLDCWHENPDLRPSFERLYQITTELLQVEHYLDLDMSKYEAHLYSHVEELETTMSHGHSLETRELSDENVTMPTEQQDSKL